MNNIWQVKKAVSCTFIRRSRILGRIRLMSKAGLIIQKPVNHGITYRINNNSLLTCNTCSDFYMNLLKHCKSTAKLYRTVLKSTATPLVGKNLEFSLLRPAWLETADEIIRILPWCHPQSRAKIHFLFISTSTILWFWYPFL